MKIFKKILVFCLIMIFFMIIFVIYEISSSKKTYYINEKNLHIPIFTYHDIVLSDSDIKDDCMQTTLKNFKKQINGLLKLGYTPISYQDLIDYKNGKKALSKRSCIITFDDGYTNVYKLAYPEIRNWNIPVTIFVIDNCVGGQGYFSWSEAKEMNDSGLVSIFSHGLQHIDYSQVAPDVIAEEINTAYLNIKANMSTTEIPSVFAYPFGNYSENSINKLSEFGYVQNLMDGKINNSNTLNLNYLHRMYPLNDSIFKISLKIIYKIYKY